MKQLREWFLSIELNAQGGFAIFFIVCAILVVLRFILFITNLI